MDLQARIDALAYPPTMTYRLSDLAATGMLAERARIFDRLAPEFCWPGKRLLDIGANKGYFSLRGVQAGMAVTAVEPDKQFSDLLGDLVAQAVETAPGGCCHTIHHGGFRDFQPARRFDRVFIGNAWHYLYKEAEGWDWVAKLAAVCEDYAQVVIEGPTGMECEDMKRVLDGKLAEGFTWAKFLARAWRWFTVSERTPACQYTPDRYVFTLRRRAREWMPAASAAPLRVRPMRVFDPPRRDKVDVWMGGGLTLKIGQSEISAVDQMRAEIAAAAPRSTPILGWIVEDGAVCGWWEPGLHGEPLKFQSEEAAVLSVYAKRQRYLLHCGLFDEDPGQPNWMHTPVHGAMPATQLIHFDKNSAFPPAALTGEEPLRRARQCWEQSFRPPWMPLAEVVLKAQAEGSIMGLLKAMEEVSRGSE